MCGNEFECVGNVDEAIETLNLYGLALIRNYVTDEKLAKLQKSFIDLFNNEYNCINRKAGHPTNPNGRQLWFDPEKASDEGMPEYSDIFRDGLVKSVSEAYFSPNQFSLNKQIMLTHLFPSEKAILPWHFDRIQSLKFWMYMKDATSEDGAFEYCPGTHWEGRYRAGYHMATGTPVQEIPNDIPEYRITNPVTLAANAGDLLIFDPDGFHRGGFVAPGHERMVIRADTFPEPSRKYGDRRFSAGWFASSSLNISKHLKHAVSRTLGEKTMDSTKNRNG